MRKRDNFRLIVVAVSYCVLNVACTPAVISSTPPQSNDGHALEIRNRGERCFEMGSTKDRTDGAENQSTTVCPFIDLRPKPDG